MPEHLRLDFLQARQAVETRFLQVGLELEPEPAGLELSSKGLPCSWSDVGEGPGGTWGIWGGCSFMAGHLYL